MKKEIPTSEHNYITGNTYLAISTAPNCLHVAYVFSHDATKRVFNSSSRLIVHFRPIQSEEITLQARILTIELSYQIIVILGVVLDFRAKTITWKGNARILLKMQKHRLITRETPVSLPHPVLSLLLNAHSSVINLQSQHYKTLSQGWHQTHQHFKPKKDSLYL